MILDLNNSADLQIFHDGCQPLGETIGITSGCFDLLHYAHLFYFQRCRRLCDTFIVGVDSDRRVKEIKGSNRPIVPEYQRIAMVDALKVVHATFIMDDLDDFEKAVHELSPDVIFRNQEWIGKEDKIVGGREAKVIIVPDLIQIDSTTKIIEEIKRRHQKKAK
jgi:rfaE bifunctional protein nucleotidyltransferase chain/domain